MIRYAAIGFLALILSSSHTWAQTLKETPYFATAVADGTLPPVTERVPATPSVVAVKSLGRQGGQMRMLMGRSIK